MPLVFANPLVIGAPRCIVFFLLDLFVVAFSTKNIPFFRHLVAWHQLMPIETPMQHPLKQSFFLLTATWNIDLQKRFPPDTSIQWASFLILSAACFRNRHSRWTCFCCNVMLIHNVQFSSLSSSAFSTIGNCHGMPKFTIRFFQPHIWGGILFSKAPQK